MKKIFLLGSAVIISASVSASSSKHAGLSAPPARAIARVAKTEASDSLPSVQPLQKPRPPKYAKKFHSEVPVKKCSQIKDMIRKREISSYVLNVATRNPDSNSNVLIARNVVLKHLYINGHKQGCYRKYPVCQELLDYIKTAKVSDYWTEYHYMQMSEFNQTCL